MVEKSHTAGGTESGWWPNLYEPLRTAGRRIAEFFAPEADAAATENAYEINVELPGVSAENVDVTIEENVLSIRGEKKSEHEEKGRTYFFSERRYGAFQRSFRLPQDVDGDNISASFKDGILTLRAPRRGPAQEKARRIEIGRQ